VHFDLLDFKKVYCMLIHGLNILPFTVFSTKSFDRWGYHPRHHSPCFCKSL